MSEGHEVSDQSSSAERAVEVRGDILLAPPPETFMVVINGLEQDCEYPSRVLENLLEFIEFGVEVFRQIQDSQEQVQRAFKQSDALCKTESHSVHKCVIQGQHERCVILTKKAHEPTQA